MHYCFFLLLLDWIIFHDQPVPCRHCHSVFRDQASRNGQDESRKGQISKLVHFEQFHHVRNDQLLPSNFETHSSLAEKNFQQIKKGLQGYEVKVNLDLLLANFCRFLSFSHITSCCRRLAKREQELMEQKIAGKLQNYNVMKNVSTHSIISAPDGRLSIVSLLM